MPPPGTRENARAGGEEGGGGGAAAGNPRRHHARGATAAGKLAMSRAARAAWAGPRPPPAARGRARAAPAARQGGRAAVAGIMGGVLGGVVLDRRAAQRIQGWQGEELQHTHVIMMAICGYRPVGNAEYILGRGAQGGLGQQAAPGHQTLPGRHRLKGDLEAPLGPPAVSRETPRRHGRTQGRPGDAPAPRAHAGVAGPQGTSSALNPNLNCKPLTKRNPAAGAGTHK